VDRQKPESVSLSDAGAPQAQPAAPAPAPSAAEPRMLRRPLLVHGEGAIATAGLILCCIVLLTTVASGWWTYQAQHEALMAARLEQVQAVESLLWQSAEVMLSQNDLSAVRRLVSDAGRTYNLRRCRIVLPDNGVIAANEISQINVSKLPAKWSDVPMGPAPQPADTSLIMLSHAMVVSGRGSARLELAAPLQYPMAIVLETQAGIGAIGVAALLSLLLVYRSMRNRLRATGAIREALLALAGGERSSAVLAVGADLGPEAGAWNKLLLERERLAAAVAMNNARQSFTDRRVNKGDLDAAFDAMSQGLVLVNDKLQAKFVNGAAAIFLQARREEMVGSDIARFIKHPEVMTAIEGVASGNVRRRTTIEVKQGGQGGQGGDAGVLKFSVRPVRRDDSASAMVIIEDVTQQRVADEARNAFVAQATHELRTPLTNIRLYVETAIEEGETNPGVRAKALNVINQEARRLENIVGEMLSVSEIEAGCFKLNRGDVRLDALFAELREDYAAQAKEKQIRFNVNLPPKLPAVQGDREKITVALHNLVGNALKYTPNGGQVTVNLSIDQRMLTVDVVDTGFGISEEEQRLVFDKFYRAKDPRVSKIAGTGLGLTLAREVVRLHGGDITVQSQLDKGSTFTLTLPVAVEAV
jgi:signal transduction histidine kinase